MASYARVNPDYLPKEDLQKFTRRAKGTTRSPNKIQYPPSKRVFSSVNLRDAEDMARDEKKTKKKRSKIQEAADTFLTPDRWASGGWKYVSKKGSPMKRFLNHPNKINFTGHSNFHLRHAHDRRQDRAHFRTSYHEQFEDRFQEAQRTQPHIIHALDLQQDIRSQAPLSPLAEKGKIMVGKKQQHLNTKDYTPEIRYGTQRMNVLNHTISHSKDWEDKPLKGASRRGVSLRQSMESPTSVSVWAGIPIAGEYSKVFNRQKTFQSEWQSACFHGGVFKDPLHYHAHP